MIPNVGPRISQRCSPTFHVVDMECFVTGHAVIDTISFQAGFLWIESKDAPNWG